MNSDDCPTFNCCLGRERDQEEDDERYLIREGWGGEGASCKEPLLGRPPAQPDAREGAEKRRPPMLLNFRPTCDAGARVLMSRPDGRMEAVPRDERSAPAPCEAPAAQRRMLTAMDVIAANEGAQPWWDDDGWSNADEDLECAPDAEEIAEASCARHWRDEEERGLPRALCAGSTPPRSGEKQSAARRAAIALLTPISMDSDLSPGLVGSQKSTSEPQPFALSGTERRQRHKQVQLLTPMSVDTAVQSPAQSTRQHTMQAVEMRTPESVFTEHVGPNTATDTHDWSESEGEEADMLDEIYTSEGFAKLAITAPRPGVVARLFFPDEPAA